MVIAPTGCGKNVLLRQLIKENLSEKIIYLVSDSAHQAVDNNDLWYRSPVTTSSNLRRLVDGLLNAKLLDPVVVIIDDPNMDRSTIDYLSALVKKIRHTKITIFILFQSFTREISPSIRNNARIIYFAAKSGRPLLELIYDAVPTKHTKKEFRKF